MSNYTTILIVATIIAIIVVIITAIVVYLISPDSFNRDCAMRHNYYRHKHRSPSLTLSKTLIQYAEKRAKELESTGIFAHPRDSPYGECLWKRIESSPTPKGMNGLECESGVGPWYNESIHYNYETAESTLPDRMVTHFTQVVWIDTKQIGCAKSFNSSTKITYIVCNYDPPGNIQGTYVQKVPKPY